MHKTGRDTEIVSAAVGGSKFQSTYYTRDNWSLSPSLPSVSTLTLSLDPLDPQPLPTNLPVATPAWGLPLDPIFSRRTPLMPQLLTVHLIFQVHGMLYFPTTAHIIIACLSCPPNHQVWREGSCLSTFSLHPQQLAWCQVQGRPQANTTETPWNSSSKFYKIYFGRCNQCHFDLLCSLSRLLIPPRRVKPLPHQSRHSSAPLL